MTNPACSELPLRERPVRPEQPDRPDRRTTRRRGMRVPAMPGLDGLRALSVAAVFAYHAEVGWLPGGFLGVDVFFVISGFLITALLISERERTGAISLTAFWRRRARRLLPALLVVLVATLVAAALVDPAQLPATRAGALAGLLYVANWHDALAHVSYFSQFGRPPLLRHLWSLSVEEQFYLLWPPLVIVALARRRTVRVAALAGAIALASGIEMALLAGTTTATRLYEGTDTRAQTLLVGALAAALAHPGSRRGVHRRLAPVALDLIGLACAAGLAAMMVELHGQGPGLFRGPLQLTGPLAAGLILAAARPGGAIAWTLSCRPLTWVGRRSYGIYLWHWPVIALTRSPTAGYGQSLALTALQAAVTLALAAATYAWIEEPIRRHGLRAWIASARRVVSGPAALRSRIAAGLAVGTLGVASMGAFVLAAGVGPGAQARTDPDAGVPRALHGELPTHGRPSAPVSPRGRPAPAPEHHPRTAPRPSGPALVFGDSVVLGCAPALGQRLGPGTRFNAVVGRQPQDTVAAVGAARAAHDLPARVVVSLGDNGVVTTRMLHVLRRDLVGVPDVVLVTPRVPDPWGPTSAAAIRDAARWWPGVRIADWARLSGARDGWFTDGVHPDPIGIHAFVSLVADAVGRP